MVDHLDAAYRIIASWKTNAGNWIATIDHAEIESRTLVTNRAIVELVLSFPFSSIIDLGCGEGWLTRELRKHGKEAYGMDVVPALIDNAIQKGGNYYCTGSYSELVGGLPLPLERFDAAVMNFSLLDCTDTQNLLMGIPQRLTTGGYVFIQTTHPASVSAPHKTGWKEGSWAGLKRRFAEPYDWYYRKLEDWIDLFNLSGLRLLALKETFHPLTHQPFSFIFVLQQLNIPQRDL